MAMAPKIRLSRESLGYAAYAYPNLIFFDNLILGVIIIFSFHRINIFDTS